MTDTTLITIEFILAFPDKQESEMITLNKGSTLKDGLLKSNLDIKARKLIKEPKYGVFNQLVSENYLLEDGDRIEAYRPLIIDPKAARQIRASKKRKSSP